MTAVQDILRSLGITRCYKGFKHTEYAICLAIQDESRLEAITKEIYMETAAHFECNWTAVERNIRTAVSRAWSVNPGLLCQMAGYPLESEPTSSQFIEISLSVCRNPLLVPLRTYDRLLFRRHFSDSSSPREHREKHP